MENSKTWYCAECKDKVKQLKIWETDNARRKHNLEKGHAVRVTKKERWWFENMKYKMNPDYLIRQTLRGCT